MKSRLRDRGAKQATVMLQTNVGRSRDAQDLARATADNIRCDIIDRTRFNGLRFLQINVGKSRASQDLARTTADALDCGIIIISEPNKALTKGQEWHVDERTDVAVYAPNNTLGAATIHKGSGYVIVEIGKINLCACYISPNVSYQQYRSKAVEIASATATMEERQRDVSFGNPQ